MDLPAGAISHYWPLEHVQIGTLLQRSATRTVVGIRAVQGSFVAALLHALRYLKFYHPLQRWARICYALDHRDLLLAAIPTKGVRLAASRAG
jgi:hypothetical protein